MTDAIHAGVFIDGRPSVSARSCPFSDFLSDFLSISTGPKRRRARTKEEEEGGEEGTNTGTTRITHPHNTGHGTGARWHYRAGTGDDPGRTPVRMQRRERERLLFLCCSHACGIDPIPSATLTPTREPPTAMYLHRPTSSLDRISLEISSIDTRAYDL